LPQPVGAQVKQANLDCGETNLVSSKKQPDLRMFYGLLFPPKGGKRAATVSLGHEEPVALRNYSLIVSLSSVKLLRNCDMSFDCLPLSLAQAQANKP
jgi:hypothetical protein